MLEYPVSIDDLLTSHRTHHAMVEFTRACNLRCTYCEVSQPDWDSSSLDFDKFSIDELIAVLKERQLKIAVLHGHGETTIIKDWHKKTKKFQDAGMDLTICTNLARDFSRDELDVLSGFFGITVSLDTIDPSLFQTLRRGGDIRQVMFNQSRIQAIAYAKDHYIQWTWSIVVVDKTIHGLIDLVNYGISVGVQIFCFCNLTEYPTPEGGTDVRHLSKLSVNEATEALQIMTEIQKICLYGGVAFDAKAGLMDTLEVKVNG